jgi:hypothetical protein
MAGKSALLFQGTKPTGWEPHRYHTVTSPEMSHSTSGLGLEVLWLIYGEAMARFRRGWLFQKAE